MMHELTNTVTCRSKTLPGAPEVCVMASTPVFWQSRNQISLHKLTAPFRWSVLVDCLNLRRSKKSHRKMSILLLQGIGHYKIYIRETQNKVT